MWLRICRSGDPSKSRFRISESWTKLTEASWIRKTNPNHTFSFFYDPHILGPTNHPILKMALDPAETDQTGHWMRTSFTRHIMRSTTKSQTTKTEEAMSKSNRKNKRPSWTLKLSFYSTKEHGNPKPTKNSTNQMESSLLDKRLERNQEKWSWKGVKTSNMKKRMKSWSKNKTTKTNNSW